MYYIQYNTQIGQMMDHFQYINIISSYLALYHILLSGVYVVLHCESFTIYLVYFFKCHICIILFISCNHYLFFHQHRATYSVNHMNSV